MKRCSFRKKSINFFFATESFLFRKTLFANYVVCFLHIMSEGIEISSNLFLATSFVRYCQFFSAFSSSSSDDRSTIYTFHSRPETVLIFSFSLRRLKRSFHLIYLFILIGTRIISLSLLYQSHCFSKNSEPEPV